MLTLKLIATATVLMLLLMMHPVDSTNSDGDDEQAAGYNQQAMSIDVDDGEPRRQILQSARASVQTRSGSSRESAPSSEEVARATGSSQRPTASSREAAPAGASSTTYRSGSSRGSTRSSSSTPSRSSDPMPLKMASEMFKPIKPSPIKPSPKPIKPSPPCGKCDTTASLSIKTDKYPADTTWTLKWIDSNTLCHGSGSWEGENGGPYQTPEKIYEIDMTEKLCEGEEYVFNIQDSFGDGMCCSFGLGYYELRIDGLMIAEGGEFGNEASIQFQVGPEP